MSTSADSSGDDGSSHRTDPTKTTTVQKRFKQRLRARVRKVRGAVRQQLQQPQQPPPNIPPAAIAAAAGLTGLAVIETLGAFRRWLTRLFETFVVVPTALAAVRAGDHWTSQYVASSYETGLRQARAILRRRGYDVPKRPIEVVMRTERHQQALADRYEQTYIGLDTAAENTRQEVRRAVADGGYIGKEVDEVSIRSLVDLINERIRANFGKRFRLVPANAVVRAANKAAMTAYKYFNVAEVGVEPEAEPGPEDEGDVAFTTAQDKYVCQECKEIAEDNPYPLSEVPIPVLQTHPHCRCFIVAL